MIMITSMKDGQPTSSVEMEPEPMNLLEAILRLRLTRGQVGVSKYLFVNDRVVHPVLIAWLRQSRFNAEVSRWHASSGAPKMHPMSRFDRAARILAVYATGDSDKIIKLVDDTVNNEMRARTVLVDAVPMTAAEAREARRKAHCDRQKRYRDRQRDTMAAFARQIDELPQPRQASRLEAHQRDADGNTPLLRRIKEGLNPELLPARAPTPREALQRRLAPRQLDVDASPPVLERPSPYAGMTSEQRIATLPPAIAALRQQLEAKAKPSAVETVPIVTQIVEATTADLDARSGWTVDATIPPAPMPAASIVNMEPDF